jgi:fibronectin-binding autotransporter adhesin
MIATCRALYLATLAGFFSLSTHNAHAQAWDGGGVDDDWATADNWSTNILPTVTGVATIYTAADVVVSGTQTVGRVNLGVGGLDSSLTVTGTGSLTFNTGSNYRLRQFWSTGAGASTSTVNVTGGTLNAYDGVDVSNNAAADQQAIFNVTAGGTATITNGNFDYTSTNGGVYSVLVDGGGSTLTVSGSTTIDPSGTLTISNGGTFTTGSGTITGVVAGAGGTFVQDGVGGTTILSGENTFDGNYTVTNGTLTIGGSGKIGDYDGDITVASGATFEYASDQNGSGSNRIKGTISGDGAFVVDAGTGSITTRGEVSVPTIEIKSGRLIQEANLSSLGSAETTVYLGDTTGSADATIEYSGGAGTRTTKTAIIVQAGSTGTKSLTGITSAIDNTDITLNDNLTLASKQHNNNDRLLTFGGVISGNGGLIIDDVPNGNGDQGLVVLSNAENNTYTGATVVDSGLLVEQVSADVDAAIWTRTTSATTIEDGATLRLDTTNQSSAGSKQAIGTITVNAGGTLELLTVASGGSQPSIWQRNGASTLIGDGTLVKSGSGMQGIAWTATSVSNIAQFNGAIQVDEGRLIFDPGNTSAVGSGNNDVSVASGAELDVRTGTLAIDELDGAGTVLNSNGTGSNTLSLGNNNGGGTFSGVISQVDPDAFSVVKNGSGTQILSGANTYNGTTTVNDGELRIDNIESGAYTGAIIVNGGTLREVTAYTGAEQGSNTTDYARAASSTTINSGGTYVLDTSSMIDNRSRVDVGTIIVNSGGVLEIAHASSNLNTDNYIWSGGSVSGDGTIRKTGAAYADVAWSSPSGDSLDSFNGLIDVDQGTLAVNVRGNSNNGGIAGSGNADLDIASGATFDLRGGTFNIDALDGSGTIENSSGVGNTLSIGNNNGSGTFSGNITQVDADAFDLVKNGSGTQTLSGANSHTGTTTVSGGTLALASGFSHSGIGAYAVGTDGTSATLKIAHLMDISSHAMTIGDGGVISPGNSPGTAITGAQTWNDGGSYLWEINDSDGSKGLTLGGTNGWDWLDITGTLDLDDLSTGGFTIDIDSLSLANSIGDAAGFESWSKGDGIVDYSFIIATTSAGIFGFDATDFSFDSSGFSNGPSWDWQIKLSGNDLVLEAYAVPEPSSTALLGLGGLALMLRRKRSAA